MGQYFIVVNLDKKQFLHPHRLGDGLKLMEFGCSGCGTMTALAVLLADSNGRGGGDFPADDPLVGSWAGDRIVITGDYGDEGRFVKQKNMNLYQVASEEYINISDSVREMLCKDPYIKSSVRESWG